MNFFIQLLISLAISIIFAPKIESQKPPSKDDIEFPTADESRNIPVVYGTVRIDGPNHIYAGNDFEVEEMTESVGGVFGIGAEDVTLGWKYYITCAVAIGFGELKLRELLFEDVSVLRYPNVGVKDVEIEIDAPQAFRNEQDKAPDNGVAGTVKFWGGENNDYDTFIGATGGGVSPLKGLSYMSFNHFYWGNKRVFPKPSFIVERYPQQVTTGDENKIDDPDNFLGDGDANPAEILFDVMTNIDFYGVGIPLEKIDIESFRDTATKLYNENFGLSFVMESGANFEDIYKDVIKHIDGNLFISPYTSKWTLNLNRDDYDINDLIEFNIGNIKSVSKYTRKEISSLKTEVKINYKDRQKLYKERNISAKSLSILKQKRGIPDVHTDDFFACKNKTLAAKIATREMRAWSTPIFTLEMITLRDAFGLQKGDVCLVNYEKGNVRIQNKVFRVIEMNFGEFNKNEITLNLVEDIFAFGDQSVEVIGDTKWEAPTDEDLDFEYRTSEAPIFYGKKSNALVAIGKHSTRAKGFSLFKQELTNKILMQERSGLVPYGFLKNDIGKLDINFQLTLTQSNRYFNFGRLASKTEEARLLGENMFYITDGINEEYISFSNFDKSDEFNYLQLNSCWRGGLDTQPKNWLAGATVYFVSHNAIISNIDGQNQNGTVVTYDLEKTYLNKANLFLEDDSNIAFTHRYNKPFLPYNLRINTVKLAETIDVGDTLRLDWNHSNRDEAVANFTWFDNEGLTKESNVVYNLYIYDDTNTLIKTELGLITDFYDFTDEVSLGGLFTQLRIVIESERLGILSNEKYDITINRI